MSQLQNTTFVNISSNGYQTDGLIGLLEECLRHNWTVKRDVYGTTKYSVNACLKFIPFDKNNFICFSTLEQISLTRAMVKDGHDHMMVFLSLKRKNS